MESITEIEALQNSANTLELTIYEKPQDDKRKTIKKYFAVKNGDKNGESVSPILDYEQMNYFLLGWRRCLKYILTTK